MAEGGVSQFIQLGLTAIYLALLVPLLMVGYRRRPLSSRSPWTLSKVIEGLALVLLILVSVASIALGLWERSDDAPRLSAVVLLAIICGSLVSLAAVPQDSAPSARAVYDLSGFVLWTAVYPSISSGPTASAVLIPSMYLLATIAVVGGAGDRSSNDTDFGTVHPITKPPSFLSYLTVAWMNPLIKYSASNILLVPNVWDVDANLSVRESLGEQPATSASWSNRPIPKTFIGLVMKNYGRPLLVSAVLSLIEVVTAVAQPFLIQALIEERRGTTIMQAALVAIVQGLCSSHALLLERKIGMRTRSALTALVCDKGIGNSALTAVSQDPSVLIEVDLFNLFGVLEGLNALWSLPLQIIVSLAAVIYILGWQSVLAACGSVILLAPFMLVCLSILAKGLARLLAAKDARLSLVKDTLARIKHIKLFAWEAIFEQKIDQARATEMKLVGRLALTSAFVIFSSQALPIILVSVSFATHLALGGSLVSSVVFPSLILFGNISRATAVLPRFLMGYQAGVISYGRIRDFLLSAPAPKHTANATEDQLGDPAAEVAIENATFEAPGKFGDIERSLLKDCNIQAAPGKLTVICGGVGSGKTTLVRAILEEIQPKTGSVRVSGRIAYAPQKPFLINGSIRDNILFGLPLDAPWYKQVIEAVCLHSDFSVLPDGDATLLEGTGLSLSGGQQSRVCLARAIYSRRPLVVLDDPLVAVDVNVQRKLIENVLGPNSILKNHTRVITASNKALMEVADSVYVIADGMASFREPLLMGPDTDAELVPNNEELKDWGSPIIDPFTEESNSTWEMSRLGLSANIPLTVANGTRRTETDLELAPLHTTSIASAAALADLGVGAVKLSTYISYLKLGKRWGWPMVMVSAIICILFNVGTTFALRAVGEEFDTVGHSSKLQVYIFCGMMGAALTIVFVIVAYFACVIPASRAIHARLIAGILKSKFSFFDTTPLGHILNRFTNDMNRVDGAVGGGFIMFIMVGLIICFSLLAVVTTSPSTMLYILPVIIIFRFLQNYYMHVCRQLRRLDNNARNPILNAASEMKNGSTVILAYDQVNFFRQRARDLIDHHVRVWMPFLCVNVWLQLRLYMLTCAVGALTAVSLVVLEAPSSTLGFVMNLVLQVTGLLGGLVQTLSNLEADLISLERVYRYALNVPEEDLASGASDRNRSSSPSMLAPPAGWPKNPSISIENYNASYRPGGALCLRKINVSIAGGERVAIVGRTGAGKSSFALALMRALDSSAVRPGSRIVIDGLDILSEVSIAELRKQITVIPQEPVVFNGSLRENLDPLGEKKDVELQDAVAKCNLVNALAMEEGEDPLEHQIVDGGHRLSTGQAQLIAIARAIAEKRRVVIVDEATASVDHDTAMLINDVMRRAFEGSTVITIAHHIATVIDHDRILVLNQGAVVEFDKPEILLNKPNSIFSQLVKDSGIDSKM